MTSNPVKRGAFARSASIALLFAAGLVVSCQAIGLFPTDSFDAMVYWGASERLREGDPGIYEPYEEGKGRPYIYPPTFAAMFAFLTAFDDRPDVPPLERMAMRPYPFPTALIIWGLLHLAALAATLCLLCRMLRVAERLDVRVAAGAVLGALATVVLDTFYGNINLFVLLALVSVLALHQKERYLLAGALLGLAAMVKVMPIMVLPVLLFVPGRKARLVAGVFAGIVTGLLLPLVWTIPAHGLVDGTQANIDMFIEYVETWVVPRVQSQEIYKGLGFVIPNNSPLAALQRLFGDGVQLRAIVWDEGDLGPLLFPMPGWLIRGAGLLIPSVLYVLSLYAAWQRRQPHALPCAVGLAFTAASMANVLFWHYHILGMGLVGASVAWSMAQNRHGLASGAAVLVLLAVGFAGPFLPNAADNLALLAQAQLYGLPTWSLVAAMVLVLCQILRANPDELKDRSDVTRHATTDDPGHVQVQCQADLKSDCK